MQIRFKWLALALVFIFALTTLIGCGGGSATPAPAGEQNQAPAVEQLVMGTNAEFPPFEFLNENNEYDGFDIDLAKEIAAILGKELVIQDMAFDGLIPALQADRVDMVVAAMTIREDRREQVAFTEPYYNAGQVIVVRADNEDIQGVEDLAAGKKIGVQLGTTGDFKAQEITASDNIIRFQQIGLVFEELATGRIDAIIIDVPVAQRYTEMREGFKIVGETLTEEFFGIAINKNNPELLAEVNAALAEIKASGKYDELISKWFE